MNQARGENRATASTHPEPRGLEEGLSLSSLGVAGRGDRLRRWALERPGLRVRRVRGGSATMRLTCCSHGNVLLRQFFRRHDAD